MKKIYVCDDDPVILMMTKRVLGRNYQVIGCQTQAVLLEEIDNDKPDLILQDFLMPEGDGLQAITRLKEKGIFPLTPVVIVSGDLDPAVEEKCREEGIKEFIHKPFVPNILLASVVRILEN